MQRMIKILAIDNEEIILKSIRKIFRNDENADYHITSCNTALDGLKFIRSDNFDLVLIDIVLSGMNGIEVLRRIKNISPSVPVIVMSGFSSVRIRPDVTKEDTNTNDILNKAAGFLLKPFTIEEMKSLVHRVLDKENNA